MKWVAYPLSIILGRKEMAMIVRGAHIVGGALNGEFTVPTDWTDSIEAWNPLKGNWLVAPRILIFIRKGLGNVCTANPVVITLCLATTPSYWCDHMGVCREQNIHAYCKDVNAPLDKVSQTAFIIWLPPIGSPQFQRIAHGNDLFPVIVETLPVALWHTV